MIGKGAFAKVYVAICKIHSRKVAVKVMALEETDDLVGDENGQSKEKGNGGGVELADLQREAAVMHLLVHPNVVTCFTSFVVGTELWLVMPFLSGGSCADIMHRIPEFKGGFKDEHVLASILKDVVAGIEYCHRDQKIHRDVKARNILLNDHGVAMLADFGVSGALVEGGLRKKRDTMTGIYIYSKGI